MHARRGGVLHPDRFRARLPRVKQPNLVLYHFDSCPYCRRVRDAMQRLKLDIPMRDIRETAAYRDELVAATGRGTVPVLRIESPDGQVQWMPESLDIVAYLEERAAAATS